MSLCNNVGVCGGLLIATAVEATFSSPGYVTPQYYNEQIACTWQIKVDILYHTFLNIMLGWGFFLVR